MYTAIGYILVTIEKEKERIKNFDMTFFFCNFYIKIIFYINIILYY